MTDRDPGLTAPAPAGDPARPAPAGDPDLLVRTGGAGQPAPAVESARPAPAGDPSRSAQASGPAGPVPVGAAATALIPVDGAAIRRARGSALMTATRLTARGLGRALARVEVTGRDRVPARGGLLIAVNHTAFVDGPLVYGVLRRPAVFLIKAEMFGGIVGATLRRIGQIPVRRGIAERAPLQRALAALAAGGVVGVFPEGTRGAGTVEQVQHGIAYLALRSGCPVVPVACHGTGALLRRGRPVRRPRVRVAFGAPIAVSGQRRASRRMIAAAAEDIRAALAAHVAATRPTTQPANGTANGTEPA